MLTRCSTSSAVVVSADGFSLVKAVRRCTQVDAAANALLAIAKVQWSMTKAYVSVNALYGNYAHKTSSSVQTRAIVSACSRVRVGLGSIAIVKLVSVCAAMLPTAQAAASGTTPAAAVRSRVH